MLAESMRRIEKGGHSMSVVNQGMKSLGEIAAGIVQSMASLDVPAAQVNDMIVHITEGINELSSVIQASSATVEEAAAAQEMAAQSDYPAQMVSRYRLNAPKAAEQSKAEETEDSDKTSRAFRVL